MSADVEKPTEKPVDWVGSSKKDFLAFPDEVKDEMGFGLYQAQVGDKNANAKPLKGFGGAGVLEIVDNYDGDTFRAVYTVKLVSAVYVLHAFQKKSKSGGKTPTEDMDLIRSRLKLAEADDAKRVAEIRSMEGADDERKRTRNHQGRR